MVDLFIYSGMVDFLIDLLEIIWLVLLGFLKVILILSIMLIPYFVEALLNWFLS